MRLLIGGGKLPKEQRKEYMDLCNQMTSRKPDIITDTEKGLDYKSIADQMIKRLEEHTRAEIDSLGEGEKKIKMKEDLAMIFGDHQRGDGNHIGRVNIVSLQVIILFTVNDPDYTDDFNKYDFPGSDDVSTPSVVITFKKLMGIEWKNYDAVKNFLEAPYCDIAVLYNIQTGTPYFKDNAIPTSEQTIYLITIIDFFTLDEINSSFLKNNILCGISYKSLYADEPLYADGRLMNPYMFLDHDIIHGKNYDFICFRRVGVNRMELIKFYEYCRYNYGGNKKKWYSIQVMMFLLIHEGWCDFFSKTVYEEFKSNTDAFIKKYFNNGLLQMNRFENPNDLNEIIPTKYRKNIEKVEEFFKIAIPYYLDALKSWHESPANPSGGSKYKGKYRRTKKVSKRKRKTNRKKSRRK